jgi:transcriptional regulator with XRE-family HTH domain
VPSALTYRAGMHTPTNIQEVSARLRAVRRSKSLSLSDVERLSGGALKAVVLGSYERGARTLSIKRAIEIARLYQVTLSHLLNEDTPVEIILTDKTVIDLKLINTRAQLPTHPEYDKYLLIARFAQRVITSRQDWNGEVLSARSSDLETISILFNNPISEVISWMEQERILLKIR